MTLWAFSADDGRHWLQDLPGLLVSNEGNFRNLQVGLDQPLGHYPDGAIRSSGAFKQEMAYDCNAMHCILLYSIPALLLHRANTAATVIVHTKIHFFKNLIIWTWSSPQFHCISDFKLAINQSHSAWELLIWNAVLKSHNVTCSGL